MSFNKYDVDLAEIHHMTDVWMHNGVVFSGKDTAIVSEPKPKEEHVSSLLSTAILGLNNTASPTHKTSKYETMWTDIDAQEVYLMSKPTCYLILGKPGLGSYSLGEALSKKYNCIHLCPKNIISDEIAQDSSTGKCLNFNMKNNIPCTYETILKMLIQKMKSPVVEHRGYVVSGVPLVTAYKSPNILIKSKYSEEALLIIDGILFDVINNLKRKKGKSLPKSGTESSNSSFINAEEDLEEEQKEEEIEPEEITVEQEIVVELPKFILNTCAYVFHGQRKPYFETQQAILLEQLKQIFKVDLKPDVIIYITSPDSDVLIKKSHKYMNYKNGQYTEEPFLSINTSDIRWPTMYTLSDYENPHNIHVYNSKYNCRPPMHCKKKSVIQVCNYRQYVLPNIEKYIMDYNPNQVIKLDGRTSIYQMMHQVMERLLLMHINPVIIPEPLYIEEPPEDLDEFWKMVEDLQVISNDVLKFGCYASPWFNRCPVELKKRHSVVGNPKLAVKFFKHIYLLSSLKNLISFCRNPRPFLKLEYLEPTCRIIIIGTKSSGKTMTAECLSWLFDTPVISFKTFLENEKLRKYDMYAKRILSEISAAIEDDRYAQWQMNEQKREAGISAWSKLVLRLIEEYVPLLIRRHEEDSMSTSDKQQQSREEDKAKKHETKDEEFCTKLNSLRERLSFLPILDNIEECKAILSDQSRLLQYAPLELITPVDKPKLPVLGDEDVTKAISDYIEHNDLQKEIEPTTEELMNEIIDLISVMDIKYHRNQYVRHDPSVRHAMNIRNDSNFPRDSNLLHDPNVHRDSDDHRESSYNRNSNFHRGINVTETYKKYIIDGLPSDPEYWEILSDAKAIPDYTFVIMENRELDPELLQRYLKINKCVKNYHETLYLVKDPLIMSKLQTKDLPKEQIIHNNMKVILDGLINNIINPLSITDSENTDINPDITIESIEKIREDWDGIKIKLEEMGKCYIEIELEDKTDVEVLEEALLKLRKCYFLNSEALEGEDIEANDDASKDLLSYNDPQNLCETNIYCPFTYYNYGILWEGKTEFSLKFNNKFHYFAKEEYVELFSKDITKYQSYNNPFKKMPKLKICVTGSIGSGKTTLSKQLAIELGLLHVDFHNVINNYFMPKHYKKVGRLYENPFTDVPLEEEAVVDFQVDEENPIVFDDIIANETELRRMLYNYFERALPVIPIYMQNIISKIWNDNPFVETGFVLDGYPRVPQDVEDMIQCNCVPDLVIALDCSSEVTIERLGPSMLRQWKSQLKDAKDAHRIKIEQEHDEWMRFIMKKVVVDVILEEILQDLVVEIPASPQYGLSAESFIMDAHPSALSNVNPKVFITYNKIVEENPMPIDTREWDTPADERERIDSRLEAIQESDYEGVESLKELLDENKIKLISIDGSKPFYKVYRLVLSKLTHLRNRSPSSLEQTFIISTDIAELLLSQGYYFLSKFGRMCPVYIYTNPQTIFNNYKISRRKNKLFPVIHRAYIYFIGSKENVIKFRTDPLMYITSDNIQTYYPYPLRIGIIGTPKSGKSTLAANLARQNNLLCVSRGMALRNILNNMPWTELAIQIFKKVNDGDAIDTDVIMSAVQTAALDHRTVTYGFVLDGFPSTPYEAIILDKYGLYPNIIFDLSCHNSVASENAQNEIHYDIFKYKPPYTNLFIKNRFKIWSDQCYKILDWINSDFQNICFLNANESKWQCLQNANRNIQELVANIHDYLAHSDTNIVLVHAMTISNATFQQKQSSFKNMCPACLSRNVIRHNGYPGDKTGVVQYKNIFYWICNDHLALVLKYPDYYLSKEIKIPEVPALVKIINANNVYENGICIVTYAANLPRQILEPGSNKFAATYKSKTYMFCSEACLQTFLDKPHMYCDITIFKGSRSFPRLSLKKLPDLGYLEQTLANILTEACCSVNAIRPKYPGLTFQLSGLIYIALYLKTRNPRIPEAEHKCFQKALKIFESRSKLILDLGLRMRSMENPFANYPKCNHGTEDMSKGPLSSSVCFSSSSTTSNFSTFFINRNQ